MSDLIAYCSRCAKATVTSELGRDRLCAFCLLDEVVSPLKAEYKRLWAKRQRYIANGVNVRNCESQLSTVARRLGDKVHSRIGRPEVAIGIINGHLAEMREQVEHPTLAKIRLPRPGDMTRRLATA